MGLDIENNVEILISDLGKYHLIMGKANNSLCLNSYLKIDIFFFHFNLDAP